ncbi:MAG: hypothetical protein Q9165_005424 [Trypethelium subeluteriae]
MASRDAQKMLPPPPPGLRPNRNRPRHMAPKHSPPKYGMSEAIPRGARYTSPRHPSARSTPPHYGGHRYVHGRRQRRSPDTAYKAGRATSNKSVTTLEIELVGEDDQDRGPSAVANAESVKYGNGANLLANQDKIKEGSFFPLEYCGFTPDSRPLQVYLDYGCINLDKPANPSSHEVVSWVKKILPERNLKTGHSGTLDPKVTGCLTVCIGKATRLVKSQQRAGKEYVCVMRLHEKLAGGENQVRRAFESLEGAVFQRPPLISAVKRQLRVRTIFALDFIEYTPDRKMVTFKVDCEAGTYIRTLCLHLGYVLGVGAHMQELRRIRSGMMNEQKNMCTLHNVKEAVYMVQTRQIETHLRTVVMPLEVLLSHLKRIVIKDTCVSSICHGAKLSATGIVRFDLDIEANEEIVLLSVKGEAVALAYAKIAGRDIMQAGHGLVATLKRVIMDREVYSKKWGLGKMSQAKKYMKDIGQLDRHGRINEKTPAELARLIENVASSPSTPSLPALLVPVAPNQLPPAGEFFTYMEPTALTVAKATAHPSAQSPSLKNLAKPVHPPVRYTWYTESDGQTKGAFTGIPDSRISIKAQQLHSDAGAVVLFDKN